MLNIPIKYMMSRVWIQPIRKKVFDSVAQSEYHNDPAVCFTRNRDHQDVLILGEFSGF